MPVRWLGRSRRAPSKAGKVARIGYLAPGSHDNPLVRQNLDAFRQGLQDLGHVEGQNIAIEYRFAEGDFDRLPDLAAELVRLAWPSSSRRRRRRRSQPGMRPGRSQSS